MSGQTLAPRSFSGVDHDATMETAFHGKSLIGGKKFPEEGTCFTVISPVTLETLPGEFLAANVAAVDLALTAAQAAFPIFSSSSNQTRADLLESIASHLNSIEPTLIVRAGLETGLSASRLKVELSRTTAHLRMFADIARDESWLDLRHVTADPGRHPTPRPELRRVMRPLGPVVVFGSSNFPLAYSVAGGDTASALATGNPVVVKAHEAHPGTSELVAEAILSAIAAVGLPPGVFSLLQGSGKDLGIPLVTHPSTRAVGFTGSSAAGRIFMDAAATRPDPIPVFAEMGSLNPVILLPSALQRNSAGIAQMLAKSITTDAGQFCTKPGIILLPSTSEGSLFMEHLKALGGSLETFPMLHQGIYGAYNKGVDKLRSLPEVQTILHKPGRQNSLEADIHFLFSDSGNFLSHGLMRQEYFGPLSILVSWESLAEIETILRSIGGQLTASIFAGENDPLAEAILPLLEECSGRIIANGVPTGVEVNAAMQHGGPWPASSDSRFTAVGPAALLRFVRPVSYQNFPETLLPDYLRQRTVG